MKWRHWLWIVRKVARVLRDNWEAQHLEHLRTQAYRGRYVEAYVRAARESWYRGR